MANATISQIKVGSTTYDISDPVARSTQQCYYYNDYLESGTTTNNYTNGGNYGRVKTIPHVFSKNGVAFIHVAASFASFSGDDCRLTIACGFSHVSATSSNLSNLSTKNTSSTPQGLLYHSSRNIIYQPKSWAQELELFTFYNFETLSSFLTNDDIYVVYGQENSRSLDHLGYLGVDMLYFPNLNLPVQNN